MQHAKRRRGPAAAATFLLAVALTIIGAPASMAAPGCTTGGSTVTVNAEDGDAELHFDYVGGWKLYVNICGGGPYNFSTTYDTIVVDGWDNEPNVITFDASDEDTVTDRMVEFWLDDARADGGITIDLGSQSDPDDTDTVVFEGAPGNDYIVADDFAEYSDSVEDFSFYGNGGKDTIYGWSGSGAAVDRPNYMEGGDDHDILHGGTWRDVLHGNDGRDTIYGMGYMDVLYGEGGDDNDTLHGDGYDDTMDGEDGDDTLYGGTGSDFLRGGDDDTGSDHVYGEEGDDVIDECASFDYLYEAGLSGCSSDITGDDFLDGGLGIDTVDYGDRDGDVTVYLPSLTSSSTGYTYGNGDDATDENDTISWMENAVTGWGDDHLTGNSKNNILDPGPDGEDELSGMSGFDTIAFLTSDCPVEVNLQNVGRDGRGIIQTYTRDGCMGFSTDFIRVWGFENVRGSEYDDTLQGNAWVNRIEGGDGFDTLLGMAGNDTFIEGSDDRYEDDIDGGLGRDTVDYSGRPYGWDDEGVVVSLDGMGDQVVEDFITTVENAIGSPGYDYLRGTDAANQLRGIGGEDLILGLGGKDLLYGGDDADDISGGDGDDTIDDGNDDAVDTIDGGSNSGVTFRRVDRCYIESGDNDTNCEDRRIYP